MTKRRQKLNKQLFDRIWKLHRQPITDPKEHQERYRQREQDRIEQQLDYMSRL
jgi:hypothetical protein